MSTQEEVRPESCDECNHSISAHHSQYGCEVEQGDGYRAGSAVLQALGPCGCTAVTVEDRMSSEAFKPLAEQIAALCIREGIAPETLTPEKVGELLNRVHHRNAQLVSKYFDNPQFREIVTRGIARAAYCEAVRAGMEGAA